jgi:O-antigen/teichoic acid export membrane protein
MAIATAVMLGVGARADWQTVTPVLMLSAMTIPLQALIKLQGELARAKHRLLLAYAPLKVVVPALIVVGAALWRLSGAAMSSEGAIALFGGALLIATVGQLVVFWNGLSAPERATTADYARRQWLWVALPMFLMDGAHVVLDRTDLLMLGAMRTVNEVGVYSAAVQTATWVNFPLFAVNAITAPVYAALYAQGDRTSLQRVVSMVAHWFFWIALAIALSLIGFGVPVLHLFGDEFGVARWALVALALGQLVNVGAGSVGYLLMMTGHQLPCAQVFFVSAVVNVILNAIAIPRLGMLGAAIATALSMMLWNVWLHALVVKYLNVRPSILFALHRGSAAKRP